MDPILVIDSTDTTQNLTDLINQLKKRYNLYPWQINLYLYLSCFFFSWSRQASITPHAVVWFHFNVIKVKIKRRELHCKLDRAMPKVGLSWFNFLDSSAVCCIVFYTSLTPEMANVIQPSNSYIQHYISKFGQRPFTRLDSKWSQEVWTKNSACISTLASQYSRSTTRTILKQATSYSVPTLQWHIQKSDIWTNDQPVFTAH